MQPIHVEGVAPRQAHTGIPVGLYEREMGKAGFSGAVSHLYHANPPTGWVRWEGELGPRAFATSRLDVPANSPWEATMIARSPSFEMRTWLVAGASALARDMDGDLLMFAHDGSGTLYTDFGCLDYGAGDLVYLPKGTLWRPHAASPTRWLMVESATAFTLPDRGLLGQHALFDPGVLVVPSLNERFRDQPPQDEWTIQIKRRNRISRLTYPFNPLDTVGWKGTLCPVKLNWRDFRPVSSHRYHVPPTAHCVFTSATVALCLFTPRPIESSADALKVPFFHSNDDYDEFVFFHSGRFFSRDSAEPGALTYHPAGFPHGPHPAAYRNAEARAGKLAEEVALNIDVAECTEIVAPADLEIAGYADSWKDYLKPQANAVK